MELEFLKTISEVITDDIANKILAENKKELQEKDGEIAKIEATNKSNAEKLKEYEKSIKDLSKNNSDNEELNKTIEGLDMLY